MGKGGQWAGAPTTEGLGMGEGRRPRPAITPDTGPWWDGLAAGRVLVQRCRECDHPQHPPEPACLACGSLDLGWADASGRGEIYSFVVCHEPPVPGLDPPYVVAVATLEEGTRLIANVVGSAPDDVRVGAAVTIDVVQADDTLFLPAFRLVDRPGGDGQSGSR